MARFERIARELEKLPCELHGDILADLEFEQLVRLSQFAGSRLTWSLENNAPWGVFLPKGHALGTLLALTYRVKLTCFKSSKKLKPSSNIYGSEPLRAKTFEQAVSSGSLSFLHYRGSDWPKRRSKHWYPDSITDEATLSHHWLSSLNEIVIDRTWPALHADYSRLIEPWLSYTPGASAVFEKVPEIGETTFDGIHDKMRLAKRNAFSIQELTNFMDFYQRIRVVRSEALAEELCQLADLYEAHPTRLTMPLAPQTRRLNTEHVPTNMRREARKIKNRANSTWWGYKEIYRYRFAFASPALVPYDWTVQLLHRVMHKHISLDSTYPEAIVEKSKIVLGRVPQWAPEILGHSAADQDIGLVKAHNCLVSGALLSSTWLRSYRPHPKDELKWLASFADLIAWMETEYPDVVHGVRGLAWDPR
jgi:hypothetical protein